MHPALRTTQNRLIRYLSAVAAAIIAFLLTLALRPITDRMPFLLLLGAVAFVALYGGLGSALLCILTGIILTYAFLLPPVDSFTLAPLDLLVLSLFFAIATFISVLFERLRRAQVETDAQRAALQVTLASIGDAVIATDENGLVTFMNATAQALTGWTAAEAR